MQYDLYRISHLLYCQRYYQLIFGSFLSSVDRMSNECRRQAKANKRAIYETKQNDTI